MQPHHRGGSRSDPWSLSVPSQAPWFCPGSGTARTEARTSRRATRPPHPAGPPSLGLARRLASRLALGQGLHPGPLPLAAGPGPCEAKPQGLAPLGCGASPGRALPARADLMILLCRGMVSPGDGPRCQALLPPRPPPARASPRSCGLGSGLGVSTEAAFLRRPVPGPGGPVVQPPAEPPLLGCLEGPMGQDSSRLWGRGGDLGHCGPSPRPPGAEEKARVPLSPLGAEPAPRSTSRPCGCVAAACVK